MSFKFNDNINNFEEISYKFIINFYQHQIIIKIHSSKKEINIRYIKNIKLYSILLVDFDKIIFILK